MLTLGFVAPALLLTGAFVPSDAWRAEQFRRAVEGQSTTHEFVLVTVVDDRTDASRDVCVPANLLLGALHREHALGYSDDEERRAIAFALAAQDRVFRLRKESALKNVEPWYMPDELATARRLVAQMESNEIVHEIEAIT